MYHSISDVASPQFRRYTLSPAMFAEHMAYLHQQNYTPITVTQFVNAAGTDFPDKPVILTFDDAFADFYTEAMPELKRYQFPATLYISTAYIGEHSRWLHAEGESTRPILTWEQLAEISRSNIECASHSHSHAELDMLSHSAASDEIVRCKRILEEQLGQEVCSFAYPFGYYSASVRCMVREAGYSSACAVKHTMSSTNADPFTLARFIITADIGTDELEILLNSRSSSFDLAVIEAKAMLWRLIRRFKMVVNRHNNERPAIL